MAVAAAPCEERDGRKEDWWPPLSVLPLLLAPAAFGSLGPPGRVRKGSAKSAPDPPNQLGVTYV